MTVNEIVSMFGGQSNLARILGVRQNTIFYWIKKGMIPARWQPIVLSKARELGYKLYADDVLSSNIDVPVNIEPEIKPLELTITPKKVQPIDVPTSFQKVPDVTKFGTESIDRIRTLAGLK